MSGNNSETACEYFKLAVKFFHEYKWVYDFKATEVLSEKVRSAVPLDFQEFFQGLNDASERFREILNQKDHDDWPVGIKHFITQCLCLQKLAEEMKGNSSVESPFPNPDSTISSGKSKLPKKWNPKKYFEVIHVGNFVGAMCKREDCNAVIDIGSGLGYLSQHIASEFEISVAGIESDPSRVQTASKEYQLKNAGSSSSCAPQKYFCLRITENISEELNPIVGQLGIANVCVTALHACGDLTPWAIKYFLNTDTCKMLAVVPCCYHKMNLETSNFPMCQSLRFELRNHEDVTFLKNQWLWRLASQRAGRKFLDNITKETRNLFYRAVLEKVCSTDNISLKRKKRNLQNYNYETFDEYLMKTVGEDGGFEILKDNHTIDVTERTRICQSITEQHEELLPWALVITGILAMQGAIQQIAEDLILLDRLSYIQESDVVKESGLVQVIPSEVSPRGTMLFGIKK